MKLQLTKTKTVEIDFSRLGGRRKPLLDVTGVALNTGDALGCPAVRLVHKKGGWHVVAAGFVAAPADPFPASWEDANRAQMTWSLPVAFQAPHAALAVLSPNMFTRVSLRRSLRSLRRSPPSQRPAGRPLMLRRAFPRRRTACVS